MTRKKEKDFSTLLKDNLYFGLMGTFLLGVILGTTFSLFGNSLDTKAVKINIEKYVVPGQKVEIKENKKEGIIYNLDLKMANGANVPILVSKDGKKFYVNVLDVDKVKIEEKRAKESQEKASVVDKIIGDAKKEAEKSGAKFVKKAEKNGTVKKPKVDLYVMSYCPFGTQAEKGFLPAIDKLGDKIDARIKFVNYVMHPGQKEGEQNFLQYCIQETQPKKYREYLKCFLEAGDTEGCLAKTNIDMKKVGACLRDTDKKYNVSDNLQDQSKWMNGRYPKFMIQDDLNKKYGVQGSPTLVINGKKVQVRSRSPQGMLEAICASFDAKNRPKECNEKLSDKNPSSGFGYGTNANSAPSAGGGCGA